jgi:hypothetical protein
MKFDRILEEWKKTKMKSEMLKVISAEKKTWIGNLVKK